VWVFVLGEFSEGGREEGREEQGGFGPGEMPLFMSDAEWEREGGNVILVVARAELYIRELEQQLETHKTRADAVSSVTKPSPIRTSTILLHFPGCLLRL
jgi:hypothetical protein